MSDKIDEIEESIGFLDVLFPGKVIEITNDEGKIRGEREFVVEGLAVFVTFITGEEKMIYKPAIQMK
ncbi:MAG: hypothetical protein V9G25_09370 [Acidimicrobiia bacterium]